MFGSTGRVGSIMLQNALDNGIDVHALIRNPDYQKAKDSRITYFQGSVLQKEAIDKTMIGCDAVISALGTDGGNVLSTSTPYIIEAMKKLCISRIITIGTAGILQARTEPELYRYQSNESRRTSTRAAEDHLQAYLSLKESGLKWTIVCPTYLPQGERIGSYRYEKDFLPVDGKSISVYDTADFAFQQLRSDEFLFCRVGLAY